MNAPQSVVEQRKQQIDRLKQIIEDFRLAEDKIIETGGQLFSDFLRDALPRVQGYALETGNLSGKITVEVSINLSRDDKTISMEGIIIPPPTKLFRKASVNY
ncbi:hypothetical protein [Geminisphaera colitermitum]|uniref:hypothetical protein n=1 Tax=Geminisphaera colitermitum TaxID=1148786 RepID=UPI000196543D|nr:hypothetical protein [Geminisphaera colitermitum]